MDMNWTAMRAYGLKLWENDALTLISCFRPVLDRKSEKSENKSKKTGILTPHSYQP